MSSEIKDSSLTGKASQGTGRKVFWRSLEEKADPEAQQAQAHGSDVVKQTVDVSELSRLNRRTFLTLSGAVSALAGIEGCIRRPVEKILPYTNAPEDVSPGVASHYATVLNRGGEALGLLVQCYEGRPTKIEGNPDHPSSLGTTDLLAQAAVLDLYDNDRARSPSRLGVPKTQGELNAALSSLTAKLAGAKGQGLHVLAQPSNSPSYLRMRTLVKERLPGVRFHTYAPLASNNARLGTKLALGQTLDVRPQYATAKVIVSLDADFLMTEPGNVIAARGFAAGRDLESAAGASMNRLYVIEPSMSVTGSNADHRLRMPAQAIGAYAKALAAQLAQNGVSLGGATGSLGDGALAGVPAEWIKAVAKDLAAHKGASLVVVGSRQPAAVHALACAINFALGNAGRTVSYVAPLDAEQPDGFDDIKSLTAAMTAGQVQTLVILGGNPVYDAPADVKFKNALAKVSTSICASGYLDETSELCTWHVPRAHELETWGDQVSSSGHYAVQQPLIAPLFSGLSDVELLAGLAGEQDTTGHGIVRATAAARGITDELKWSTLLQKGVAEAGDAQLLGAIPVQDQAVSDAVRSIAAPNAAGEGTFEVVFLPDHRMLDGRHANNSWLLELPDPISRITWDNAALFAPSTAKSLGIANGDMVRLSVGGASIDIVAWMQPGQDKASIALPLGWGRTKAGKNAVGAGFDVYPLRNSASPHFVSGVKVEKLGKSYPISQTQDHDSMEGRPLAIDASLAEYQAEPEFTQWKSPDPEAAPLWKTVDYSEGHQWGMVIDLNTCIGCSACVVACQSENNVPTVGKDQVSRGREMHWLRIDRYFVGDDADEPEVAYQPIGCQHCEQAPCENVCPVNATSHSPEGLNDIAYNRCIGTRYCMNNCPYKVRRFNFLNFNQEISDTHKMQKNPNVTVRFRGVVEKCSYCVQRIQGAKISARRDGRKMKDGEVVSACQQACPSQAISFGDINDPDSRVSRKRKIDRAYALLADVGTHPRTRFLGKIRNPNPEMTEKQG